ncbi:MAG: hypothetical protein R3Y54_11000 [Eubacteriales bacterium]
MNIDNCIQSNEVREYLQEIEHEFTDFEKATIIYNLSANIAIRNEKLIALQQETRDEVLRRQIQERLEYDQRVLEQFYDTDNGKYIMVVFGRYKSEFDGRIEEDPIGYFTDGELAKEYARRCWSSEENGYGFDIRKQRLITRKEELQEAVKSRIWTLSDGKGELSQTEESTYEEYASIEFGELCYSKEGALKYFWVQELVEGEEQILENYSEHFEEYFVEIPHPFQVGDHVRIIGTETTGMISYVVKKEDFPNVILDWSDAAVITVDYDAIAEDIRTECGEEIDVPHQHVHPMCLERMEDSNSGGEE